jgi:hypothetical protein
MSLNVPTVYGHVDRYIPERLSYEYMHKDQKFMLLDGEYKSQRYVYVTQVRFRLGHCCEPAFWTTTKSSYLSVYLGNQP